MPAQIMVRRTVETMLRPPGISLERGESGAERTLARSDEYRDNSIGVGAIGRPWYT